MNKTITIACDHAGYDLKNALKKEIINMGFKVLDCGTNSSESVDYPDFAKLAVKNILKKKSEIGILICGSGIGMSITANRFKGIRAALCRNKDDAKDRKSTRLNSSHKPISYAVFCLKKKNK